MMGKTIALFGGAFNPPHKGHVSAAERVLDALEPDILLVMPTGVSPHKPLPAGSPAPEHRLAMTRLAFAHWPNVQVSDWEMTQTAPNYTVDTVQMLRVQYPAYQIYIVMGTDMFLSLQEWRRPDRLLELAGVAILARDTGQERAMGEQAEFLAHRYGALIRLIAHEPLAVSSTQLRDKLRRGQGDDCLPPAVADYIRVNGLYAV